MIDPTQLASTTHHQRAFLETTVQNDRITLSKARKEGIAEALAGKTLVSSTYVLGEFKATFLQAAVIFHKLLVDSPSVREAQHRFERYSERPAKRLFRLSAGMTEDRVYHRDNMIAVLEMMIEWQLVAHFRHGLDGPLLDDTKCRRAHAQPQRLGKFYVLQVGCAQHPAPQCGAVSNVARHRDRMSHVAENLVTKNKKLQQLKSTLKSVIHGQQKPHGNACRDISDLVITLEVPGDAALATTDHHFVPLAKILGHPPLFNPCPKRMDDPDDE